MAEEYICFNQMFRLFPQKLSIIKLDWVLLVGLRVEEFLLNIQNTIIILDN